MKTCKICRAEIPKGIRFCPSCGTPHRGGEPAVVVLVVLFLAAGAVVGHDLLKPGQSWVLHYLRPAPPAAQPAEEVPVIPPEPAPAEVPAPVPPAESAPVPASPASAAAKPVPAVAAPVPEAAPAARPAAAVPGFVPPKLGGAVTVTLRTGAAMKGILRKITERSIDLESDPATLTLDRAQMALESRAKFFAADYAEYMAAKEAAAAAEASREPSGVTAGRPPAPARTLTTPRISSPKPAKHPAPPAESATNALAPAGDGRDAKDVFFDAFK